MAKLVDNQFVWTAQDELERLLATQELTNSGRQRQLARMAILNVLRDMPNRTRWAYYNRQYTLRTTADQAGTVTYDHTGGSSERLLTLATATLPTDGTGEYYTVLIGEVAYDIERVLTSSTCQLTELNNPGEDVASGTACTVYRAYYPLPTNFRKLAHVWDIVSEKELRQVPMDQWQAGMISVLGTVGEPDFVSVVNFGELTGSLALMFAAPPDSARSYSVAYEAGPASISTWKYSNGKASTSSATVTLSDGGVTATNMVGAIMRFTSSTTHEPTSLVGGLDGTDNPFMYQRQIIARPSSSTLTLNATIDTLTAVKYTISDPIDIEPGAMLLAFQKLCDAEYAALLKTKDRGNLQTEALMALRLAMENDQRSTYAVSTWSPYDKFRNVTVTTE